MVHNYMEEIIAEKVTELIESDRSCCACTRCNEDIIAFTLNRIQPRYYIGDRGFIHSKVANMRTQCEIDIVTTIIQGIETIAARPRHDK